MCANLQSNRLNTITVRASYILPIWSDFLDENQEKPGGGLGVDPLNWQSLNEIGEMACSTTTWCSRGHALKSLSSWRRIRTYLTFSVFVAVVDPNLSVLRSFRNLIGPVYSFPFSFFVLFCFVFFFLLVCNDFNGFRFFSQNWATVIVCFFVLLPTGATACVELKRFEEAITWCDKGLAVSFEGIFHF